MKIFSGKVISTKMTKTATVAVERIVAHPVYKKRYKRVKKYHVHDDLGARVGQKVKFVASKPYSKLKRWKIIEIIESKSGSKSEERNKKDVKSAKAKKSIRKKR